MGSRHLYRRIAVAVLALACVLASGCDSIPASSQKDGKSGLDSMLGPSGY